MTDEGLLTDEEASALLTDPRLRAYVMSINDEEQKVVDWLLEWQNWNRQMHHELHIGRPGDMPDDTQGRRALADRLRAGEVAAEAVARLRAERNQLRYEASLLAEMVHLLYGPQLGLKLNQDMRALVERHYKPGVVEPNGDTVPHPYRMTPELAAALSGLCVAEDPDPEHQAEYHTSTLPETFLRLHKAVERVTAALYEQQPEFG